MKNKLLMISALSFVFFSSILIADQYRIILQSRNIDILITAYVWDANFVGQSFILPLEIKNNAKKQYHITKADTFTLKLGDDLYQFNIIASNKTKFILNPNEATKLEAELVKMPIENYMQLFLGNL